MTTTITWGTAADTNGVPRPGGQTAVVNHPRELLTWGHPKPPRQPIASWAGTLANFQAACTAGDYRGALTVLASEYVIARTSDVPGGALAALKTWMRANVPGAQAGQFPEYLHPDDSWGA
jgi:hypothetical protein